MAYLYPGVLSDSKGNLRVHIMILRGKKKELFFIMESLAKSVVKQLFLCISQYL